MLTERPQTGLISVYGQLPQITVIIRNDLFHKNSPTCHFGFSMQRRDLRVIYSNNTFQLIFFAH